MSLPPPRPGLVIRYAYLWRHQAQSGAIEARKDRPCAIVLALRRDAAGDLIIVVAPITTVAPRDPEVALPLPPAVRRSLGLDAASSWIMTDEVNVFAWPGFDLRALPGRPGDYAYGMLPPRLFDDLRQRILTTIRTRRATVRR